MKMLMVAYSEALESKVMDALVEAGVENYTEVTQVLGKGRTSGPHMGTHVWPKQNNLLIAAVNDKVAKGAIEAVNRLRQTLGNEGIKAFVLPIEEMT